MEETYRRKREITVWHLQKEDLCCLSLRDNDLCTWSDKHSPVWENIKGSVRTVPEERKSILKLVPSTTRGAGITSSSRSIVVTSMMTSAKLRYVLLTDIRPGLCLGDTCSIHGKRKLFSKGSKIQKEVHILLQNLWITQVPGSVTLFM